MELRIAQNQMSEWIQMMVFELGKIDWLYSSLVGDLVA